MVRSGIVLICASGDDLSRKDARGVSFRKAKAVTSGERRSSGDARESVTPPRLRGGPLWTAPVAEFPSFLVLGELWCSENFYQKCPHAEGAFDCGGNCGDPSQESSVEAKIYQ